MNRQASNRHERHAYGRLGFLLAYLMLKFGNGRSAVADMHSFTQNRCSRRRFLHLGAAGGGAALGLGLLGSATLGEAAAAKVSKQTAGYQQAPKGQARCGTCSFFQSPSSCNYVEGPVNPEGWCTLYHAKT